MIFSGKLFLHLFVFSACGSLEILLPIRTRPILYNLWIYIFLIARICWYTCIALLVPNSSLVWNLYVQIGKCKRTYYSICTLRSNMVIWNLIYIPLLHQFNILTLNCLIDTKYKLTSVTYCSRFEWSNIWTVTVQISKNYIKTINLYPQILYV